MSDESEIKQKIDNYLEKVKYDVNIERNFYGTSGMGLSGGGYYSPPNIIFNEAPKFPPQQRRYTVFDYERELDKKREEYKRIDKVNNGNFVLIILGLFLMEVIIRLVCFFYGK